MKKLIWIGCLLFTTLNAHAAFDWEKFCRSDVEQNTARAEWGLQLRAQMLQACGQNPSKKCRKSYVDAIAKQNDQDMADLIQAFNKTPDIPEVVRQSGIASVGQWEKAAAISLFTGDSAQKTANHLYSECISLAARAGSGGYSAPATSGNTGQSGCTNYTVMGQSGRTEYCQKCCYSGNCNVYCN